MIERSISLGDAALAARANRDVRAYDCLKLLMTAVVGDPVALEGDSRWPTALKAERENRVRGV